MFVQGVGRGLGLVFELGFGFALFRWLLELAESDCGLSETERLMQVRKLYEQAGVFETALKLVDKHQARAEKVADEVDVEELRRLLYFLVDTVLERPELPTPAVVSPCMVNGG